MSMFRVKSHSKNLNFWHLVANFSHLKLVRFIAAIASLYIKCPDASTFIPSDWCKVGVGICYDIRFTDLASIYNQKGNDKTIIIINYIDLQP